MLLRFAIHLVSCVGEGVTAGLELPVLFVVLPEAVVLEVLGAGVLRTPPLGMARVWRFLPAVHVCQGLTDRIANIGSDCSKWSYQE